MGKALKYLLLMFPFCLRSQTVKKFNGRDIYVYHDTTDTLFFSNFNFKPFIHKTTFYLTDSVQVDGAGAKELVFYRTLTGGRSAHGGTFDYEESRQINLHEVWNPDTKQCVFQTASFYQYEFDCDGMYHYQDSKHGKIDYFSAFKIDSTGIINIKGLQINSAIINDTTWVCVEQNGKKEIVAKESGKKSNSYNLIPLWPPVLDGTYSFKEDKYIKQ